MRLIPRTLMLIAAAINVWNWYSGGPREFLAAAIILIVAAGIPDGRTRR